VPGQRSDVLLLAASLPAHCRGSSHLAITRCRDGSSPIASALAVGAPALFVSLSHHACRRDKALRSESTHRLHCQIRSRDPALVAAFALVALVEYSHTTQKRHRRPQTPDTAHCKRRTPSCGHCVCFARRTPPTPLCLRHYVSHRLDARRSTSDRYYLHPRPSQPHNPSTFALRIGLLTESTAIVGCGHLAAREFKSQSLGRIRRRYLVVLFVC
jgi:hypothetical protein